MIVTCSGGLTYSPGMTYCDSSGVSTCAQAVTNVPIDSSGIVLLHIMAAFPDTSNPRMNAVSFGIDYDAEKMWIVDKGSCGGWELPTSSWPAPGSGTALTWTDPKTERLTEVYWIAAYVYLQGADSTQFSLTDHGRYGGEFSDDSTPGVRDDRPLWLDTGACTTTSFRTPRPGSETVI